MTFLPNLLLILLATFALKHSSSENVHLKGNLLFTEVGRKSLNQEYMVFIRTLNSSDLQLLAYHLQSSITLYYTFCDSVKSSLKNLKLNITRAKTSPPKQFHHIKSFSTHTLAKAYDVCRDLKGRVPEIGTVEDLRDLQDFAISNKVETVRAAIEFDTIDKKFRFTSDRANARDTKLFDEIFYGGEYTSKSHPAKWEEDKYLTRMATDWPLHYFIKANTVKLYMSDKQNLETPTIIICQK